MASFSSCFESSSPTTHLCVYDYPTQQTHTDFGRLQSAKVVLLAEVHGCTFLKKIHAQLIRLLATGRTCVLIEGVPAGIAIPLNKLKRLGQLPESVVIQGWDNRYRYTLEECIDGERWGCEKDEKEDEYRELLLCEMSRRVELLNAAVFSGKAKKIDGTIEVDRELGNSIYGYSPGFMAEVEKFDRVIQPLTEKLKERSDSRRIEPGESDNVASSNESMLAEIRKAEREFDRVFVIAGHNHIKNGEALFKGLKHNGITPLSLFPTQELYRSAWQHTRWRGNRHHKFSIAVRHPTDSGSKEFALDFPLELLSRIHPAIRPADPSTDPVSICFGSELVAKAAGEPTTLIIEPGTRLEATEIPGEEMSRLAALSHEKLVPEIEQAFLTAANCQLAFSHARVTNVHMEGSFLYTLLEADRLKRGIGVTSPESMTVTVLKGQAWVSLPALVEGMQSRLLPYYELAAGQILVLSGINREQRDALLANRAGVQSWMNNLLTETQIKLSGTINIFNVEDDGPERGDCPVALSVPKEDDAFFRIEVVEAISGD